MILEHLENIGPGKLKKYAESQKGALKAVKTVTGSLGHERMNMSAQGVGSTENGHRRIPASAIWRTMRVSLLMTLGWMTSWSQIHPFDAIRRCLRGEDAEKVLGEYTDNQISELIYFLESITKRKSKT
jgi:hypothetical protein